MTSICGTLIQNLLSAYQALIAAQGQLLDIRLQMVDVTDHTSPLFAQLQQKATNAQNEITGWQGTIAGLNQQLSDNKCFQQPQQGTGQ